jgi:hypothetical protein
MALDTQLVVMPLLGTFHVHQIAPVCTTVGISYAQIEYSTSTNNTIIALHQGVFQGIIVYLIYRESGAYE